jgi:UDP-glucose 4-epimerase
MTTVFITGAHGFIGQHLARYLSAQGVAVGGLGHGNWAPSEAAAAGLRHWVNGEIAATNLALLSELLGRPDIVFHLAGGSSVGAAVANPREDFARTVATTVELLEWMRQDTPRTAVVAISSAAVYGGSHQGPIGEGASKEPYSPYGHHKLMMESLCRSYGASYGLRSVVARLFSVFGPGLRKQLLWDVCSRLEAGETLLTLGGSGDELRDWTAVEDVVRALAILPACASSQATALNVGTGVATPVREAVGWIAQAWGGPVTLQFSGQSRPGDPFSLVADGSHLADLGFAWPRNVPEAMAAYVEWFRCRNSGGC